MRCSCGDRKSLDALSIPRDENPADHGGVKRSVFAQRPDREKIDEPHFTENLRTTRWRPEGSRAPVGECELV